MTQRPTFCKLCRKQTLHARDPGISDGAGCLLTLLTAGMFLPLWLLMSLLNSAYMCQTCGTKNLTQAEKSHRVLLATLSVMAGTIWYFGYFTR